MFSHNSTFLQEEATSKLLSGKRKRNLPGQPDPDAEVVALSPNSLMATNRFVCEICKKGFQREQNLQLHRRGHNLPWKLKQRNGKEVMRKKVYVCPEKTCIHHDASRALGDLTGIKKHYCRKHGEKKWKCEKCCKIYAVQSDCKAHSKTCGARDYRCHCGTLFSRKDSFMTHRAFCEALAEENTNALTLPPFFPFSPWRATPQKPNHIPQSAAFQTIKPEPNDDDNDHFLPHPSPYFPTPPHTNYLSNFRAHTLNVDAVSMSSSHLSATAMLQKAASVSALSSAAWANGDHPTRDFLGLERLEPHVSDTMSDLLTYAGDAELERYDCVSEGWGDC